MYQPGTTYRIQFHKDFTFSDFETIIPYLHELGIKTIYASPIFDAVKGSVHGYDGINPNHINPEIGTLDQLRKIAAKLKKLGMGWLQDFVPNHMAFTPENEWLCDYLEKGKMSNYDTFFDKNPDEPLMVPFLGSTLEEALDKQQIKMVYHKGKLHLKYFDLKYPLNYTGHFDILNHEMFDSLGFEGLRHQIELLSQIMDKERFHLQWSRLLTDMETLLSDSKMGRSFKSGLLKLSHDSALLKKIIDLQFYRFCYWKDTNSNINYRRFFTVNGLICLNMQEDVVFEQYHQLLHQLVQEELIQGIRIDHIDGLYNPAAYLQQLRDLVGKDVYIIVEKILERDEQLPVEWPVQGTSGYDFLAKVNNVLTNVQAAKELKHWYKNTLKDNRTPEAWSDHCKRKILNDYMKGEWSNLLHEFKKCSKKLPPDVSEDSLKQLIGEVLIACPVYRYYTGRIPFNDRNAKSFETLICSLKEKNIVPAATLDFFQQCFTSEALLKDKKYARQLLHFWRRCMQVSGPLMAKGIEDTFMYSYAIYLAQNEVGDNPAIIGASVDTFHKWMKDRQQYFPSTLNATATHDTKRGEDSRARLRLISADVKLWLKHIEQQLKLEPSHAKMITPDEQYFILQSIYAALENDADDAAFKDRLKAFVVKAAREAKAISSWDEPDEAYEDTLTQFAFSVVEAQSESMTSLRKYITTQQDAFVANALAQLTLKCTCPGVPDFYQGTELWDFSFVDPDNRRPVDYKKRKTLLQKISKESFDRNDLKPEDASIKLFAMQRLLQLRNALPDVFEKGLYEPISVSKQHLAFIRRYHADWVIVVVSLGGKRPVSNDFLQLPAEAPAYWSNIFTDTVVQQDKINLTEAFDEFSVLVLRSVPQDQQRKAGILMSLFSLPSSYGIGGMGQEAYDFIAFLHKGRQRFWQILPLNPTLKECSYSPYASSSAFAGDAVYIDPVLLQREGLLTEEVMASMVMESDNKVDYGAVKAAKERMLRYSWKTFKEQEHPHFERAFNHFCEQEKDWLNLYAMYIVIKKLQHNAPWYQWPQPLKDMEPVAIQKIMQAHKDALDFQKWMQFLFFKQWDNLKSFAKQHQVELIGDVPFYMGHDSADVWADQAFYNLNEKGDMLQTAGVPPDYYSATGQAWGMPTYRWHTASKDLFDWWIKRLKHNIRLYDKVRLDHFRAFYDYWEIPATAADATHGSWQQGPQHPFFDLLQKHFPEMPFIAEDLGEIHQGVFDFKDYYKLAGMRVLQFGLDTYKPTSRDLPHNFKNPTIVYTGTHDNNTIVGWFRELSKSSKSIVAAYTGKKLTLQNIAETLVIQAYSSIATIAIVPVQDILGLDEKSRVNTPSTVTHNWEWRLQRHQLSAATCRQLLDWMVLYNR